MSAPDAVIPTDVRDVQEIVRDAFDREDNLRVRGASTRSFLGRRGEPGREIDLSSFDQLVCYEPAELILVAGPAMRLTAVESLLAEHGQHLAFEPPHWSADATLGGTVASGLSGPRRFKSGALRDFVLGVELVDGRGERIRAGGRVVKNVTGYDLPRALSGSFGTLGLITEVCLKLWPRPESECTVVVEGLSLKAAAAAMADWARLPYEITGMACVASDDAEGFQTLLRLEGSEAGVRAQTESLRSHLNTLAGEMVEADSRRIWRDIRERTPWLPREGEQLWRFSTPPGEVADLVDALLPYGLARHGLDAAGAMAWCLFPGDVNAAVLHELASGRGGTAWRFANSETDDNSCAFTPLPPPLAKANRLFKRALDPRGVLNRGRMYADL